MTDIVVPRVVPHMPPAPLTTDPPQIFDDKAIAMAAGYPATIGGMNNTASDTYQNAVAVREFAVAMQTLWGQVSDGVITIQQALAAIQAGPVVSVMGRSGVVTGLVEQTQSLPSGSDLNTAVTSGFYRLTDIHGNAPPAPFAYNYSQMRVERGGDTLVQEITTYDGMGRAWRGAYNLYGPPVFSEWQRVLGDRSLIERGKYVNAPGSAYTADPREATLHALDINGPCTITIPAPRKMADQLTIMLSFVSVQSFVFSSNVKAPSAGLRTPISSNILTIPLVSRHDGLWSAFDGGFHPW